MLLQPSVHCIAWTGCLQRPLGRQLSAHARSTKLLHAPGADGIPIFMRILAGERFQPGPFHLGRWSPYIGGIAVSWVVVITVCAARDECLQNLL